MTKALEQYRQAERDRLALFQQHNGEPPDDEEDDVLSRLEDAWWSMTEQEQDEINNEPITDELLRAYLTPKQRHILEHALGAVGKEPGYRNHFVADATSEDGIVCESLCSIGLMTRHQHSRPHYNVYAATSYGQRAVGITERK